MLVKRLVNASKPACQLRFDSEALKLLCGHEWPGNVRELENIIERLALTVGENGIISAPDVRCDFEFNGVADTARCQDEESAPPNELREMIISRRFKCLSANAASVDQSESQELALYLRQVAEVGGNLAEAARQLRIKRTTLHMRIKSLQRKANY